MKKVISTTKAVLPVAAVMTLSVAALPFGYCFISKSHAAGTVDLQSGCVAGSEFSTQKAVNIAAPILQPHESGDFEVSMTESLPESEAAVTEASFEDNTTYTELELHNPTPHICSWAEAYELVASGRTRYVQNNHSPNLIDTQKYISAYFGEETIDNTDTNDLERKSYIYHMMLNSIDYIQTAQGTVIEAIVIDSPCTIEFQTDIRKQCAYEVTSVDENPLDALYVSDEVKYSVNLKAKTYTQTRRETQEDFIISDNDRVLTLNDGECFAINRPDKSNLSAAGSCCLYPQSYAMSRLDDFDTWEITSTESVLDRTCAVIEGTYRDCPFRMYVDINTGILLKYEVYDKNNIKTGYIETTSITLNEDIEVKQFYSAGYTPEAPELVNLP